MFDNIIAAPDYGVSVLLDEEGDVIAFFAFTDGQVVDILVNY